MVSSGSITWHPCHSKYKLNPARKYIVNRQMTVMITLMTAVN